MRIISCPFSNGKSALNSKGSCPGVGKKQPAEYRSKEYDRETLSALWQYKLCGM